MSAPFPIETRDDPATMARRVVAWVDGVGAFLLCFDDAISLGGLAGRADVRIAADLAAEHATVKRSGEGYVVESNAPALVASENSRRAGGVSLPSASKSANRSALRGSGRVVVGQTDLNNGDELLLYREGGSGVRLKFSRPNVLTSTAVLTLASEHRTEPRFDGIVMFAEACVFGPNLDAHVRCKDWEESVLLFRRDGQLWARSAAPLSVAGKTTEQLVQLHPGDYVTAPGISFRLEAP